MRFSEVSVSRELAGSYCDVSGAFPQCKGLVRTIVRRFFQQSGVAASVKVNRSEPDVGSREAGAVPLAGEMVFGQRVAGVSQPSAVRVFDVPNRCRVDVAGAVL